jgi:hypothetical protein
MLPVFMASRKVSENKGEVLGQVLTDLLLSRLLNVAEVPDQIIIDPFDVK